MYNITIIRNPNLWLQYHKTKAMIEAPATNILMLENTIQTFTIPIKRDTNIHILMRMPAVPMKVVMSTLTLL